MPPTRKGGPMVIGVNRLVTYPNNPMHIKI